jgi:3-oxoacyl-[acyl-carrier protein] reductase
MRELQGKKVLVTGGGRGIGAAIARRAAEGGADVLITYRSNADAANALVSELAAADVRSEAVAVDVRDRTQVEALVVKGKEFGVNCLVNNAGVRQDAPLFMMKHEAWDAVVETNLGGFYNVTRAFIPVFMRAKAGSIVNISSVSGVYGVPGQTNYAATKAGMIGFTRALAKEVGKVGIRANVVAPGYIQTDMTAGLSDKQLERVLPLIPLGALGKPEDVAHLACFLMSDQAAYITGQVFLVDGGMSA